MSLAYQFLLSTAQSGGARSLQLLAETNDKVRAECMTVAVESMSGRPIQRRRARRVIVTDVNGMRFSVFNLGADRTAPKKGQVFPSLAVLSAYIGAHPTSMRQALSLAWKAKQSRSATVRGVKFSYYHE